MECPLLYPPSNEYYCNVFIVNNCNIEDNAVSVFEFCPLWCVDLSTK